VASQTRAKGTRMSLHDHRATRSRRTLLPVGTAAAPPRIMLTHDDLLWHKTSEDHEGRLTLGLLACSPRAIGVLVDDNGESLGLRLSRAEAEDLHRTLGTWLAGTPHLATS
jgi:hypothetical protein